MTPDRSDEPGTRDAASPPHEAPEPRAIAYVGIGSNLGDREATIRAALEALRSLPDTEVLAVSSWYETDPVGNVDQPRFLNGAARLATGLDPATLLWNLHRIESSLGRVRTTPKGPRTIDLDLLLHGDRIESSATLVLPHPELHRRAFVLVPLVELDPLLVHPVTGETLLAHLARLGSADAVRRDVRRSIR